MWFILFNWHLHLLTLDKRVSMDRNKEGCHNTVLANDAKDKLWSFNLITHWISNSISKGLGKGCLKFGKFHPKNIHKHKWQIYKTIYEPKSCRVLFINSRLWKIVATYTCALYYAWPHLHTIYICIISSKA